MALKPNLKCTKFAQYKAEYEEKIAIAEKNIDNAVAECKKVTDQHDKLMNDKNELMQIRAGGFTYLEIVICPSCTCRYWKVEDLLYRISSTRPIGLRLKRMICKSRLMIWVIE